ncbi:MAG: hypothetical protein ABFS16_14510 [Bacteroidota bacterium]
MSSVKLKYLFLILSVIFGPINLKAQSEVQFSTYIDVGENNASEGVFIRTAGFGMYRVNKFNIKAGAQIDLISPGNKVLTGTLLQFERELSVKEFPFQIQGLYLCSPFSELIHEHNWGILGKIQRKHFTYKLGTNFRTYRVTPKAERDYNILSGDKVNEKWNLMYLLSYNLKPVENNWNIGITLTNIDQFIINQETNPVLNLNGKYRASSSVTLFSELWYKSAGALNISVNYFGFFIRTGLIWKIDLEK